MADLIALRIIDKAVRLAEGEPATAALAALDRAMDGARGADLDMEADPGHPWSDWLDPPSPFARVLRDAFAPDLSDDPWFVGDVWADLAPGTTQPMAEVWRVRVIEPFAARYALWGSK